MSPHGFDEFYARAFPGVLAAAILASGNRRDAEDAVQDAFIIALRRWDEVAGYDAPDAWVRKVSLRLLARSGGRQRRGEQWMLEVKVPPQATPAETAHAREVLAALATLPAPVRIALIACTVLGWTQPEAAEVLGVPRNTIANRIFRGRAMLARRLGMDREIAGAGDPLVPGLGPVARFTVLDEDPLGISLARLADWLRDGIESDPDAAFRSWTRIVDPAAAPRSLSQPSRWRFARRRTAWGYGSTGGDDAELGS